MIIASYDMNEIFNVLEISNSANLRSGQFTEIDPKTTRVTHSIKVPNIHEKKMRERLLDDVKENHYYVLHLKENQDVQPKTLVLHSGLNYTWQNTESTFHDMVKLYENNYSSLSRYEPKTHSLWLIKRQMKMFSNAPKQLFYSQKNMTISTVDFPKSQTCLENYVYQFNFKSKRINKSNFVRLFDDRLEKKKAKDLLRMEVANKVDDEHKNYYDKVNKREQDRLEREEKEKNKLKGDENE